MADARIEITERPDDGRYVLTIDGSDAGEVAYRRRGRQLIVDHTEVDPAFEGQGLGSRLARHVLDAARAEDLRIVPNCPFLRGYLDRHPEDATLVDPRWRRPDAAASPGDRA